MAGRKTKKTAGSKKMGKKIVKTPKKQTPCKPKPAKAPKGRKGPRTPPTVDQKRARFEEIGRLTPVLAKKWTYERELELCQLWQEEDHLYNARNKDYRDPDRRTTSFARIAAIMRMDPVDVETHAKSLRTSYTKLTSPEPSGSSPMTERLTKRQREILQLCSFLANHIRNRETISNLPDVPEGTTKKRRSPRLAGKDPKEIKKKRFVMTAAAAKAARDAQAAAGRQRAGGRAVMQGKNPPKKGTKVKGRQANGHQAGVTVEENGLTDNNVQHESSVSEETENEDNFENDDPYVHEFPLHSDDDAQVMENGHDMNGNDNDDDSYVFNVSHTDSEEPSPSTSKDVRQSNSKKRRQVHEISDFEDDESLDEDPIPTKKKAKRGQAEGDRVVPEFYVTSQTRRTSESKKKDQLADIMENRTHFLKSLTTSIENIADSREEPHDRNEHIKDNYDLWASILASRIPEMEVRTGARFMLYVDKMVIDVVEGAWIPPK